jgi:hypothetical protein
MLKRWRLNRTGLRAVAVILTALMFTGSLDAYHLAKDDDPDFGPSVVLHDHARRGLHAPAKNKTASDPHCAICHWLQSLGTSRVASRLETIPPASRLRHSIVTRVHTRLLARVQLPARGPPIA